jgi:hypothetical protein
VHFLIEWLGCFLKWDWYNFYKLSKPNTCWTVSSKSIPLRIGSRSLSFSSITRRSRSATKKQDFYIKMAIRDMQI